MPGKPPDHELIDCKPHIKPRGHRTNAKTSAQPPAAEKSSAPHPDPRRHTPPDDYFWMRDKQNPEVAAYLEAENAYADSFMGPDKRRYRKAL